MLFLLLLVFFVMFDEVDQKFFLKQNKKSGCINELMKHGKVGLGLVGCGDWAEDQARVSHTTPGYTFLRRTPRPRTPLKITSAHHPHRPPLAFFQQPWPRRPRRRRQLPLGRRRSAPALAASPSPRPSRRTAVVTLPPPTRSSVGPPSQLFSESIN